MTTPKITIDMDKKCSRCGTPGVVNETELCLKCLDLTKYLHSKYLKAFLTNKQRRP